MPILERTALQMATGRILDVGAGSGCHALALQEMGKKCVTIDILPLSVRSDATTRSERSAPHQPF